MATIMAKIKLRVLNSGYVIAIDMSTIYVNFQMNLQVLLKVMVKLV